MSSKKKSVLDTPEPDQNIEPGADTQEPTTEAPIPAKDDILTLLGPKSTPKSVLINVTVLSPVKSFIEAHAKERGTTVSDVIREALFAYISNI